MPQTVRSYFVVAAALALGGVPASAQELTGRMETFHVRDARVHELVAVPDGLLMATSTGVVRLDGDGRVVGVEDAGDSGLGANWVDHLVEGLDGELWAAGDGWLARSDGPGRPWALVDLDGTPLDYGVWREDENDRVESPQRPIELAVGPDGALWMGTAHGVVRYHDGRWTTYDADPEGPGARRVEDLTVDVRGRVYATYDYFVGLSGILSKLSVLSGGTWTSVTFPAAAAPISELVAPPTGGAWLVRYHGSIEVYDGTAFAGMIEPPGEVVHVAFLPSGAPLVAGRSGVYAYGSGGWGIVTEKVQEGRVATVGEEVWAIGQVPSRETGGYHGPPTGGGPTFEIEMAPAFYSVNPVTVVANGDGAWAAGEHGLAHHQDGAWGNVPLPDGYDFAGRADVDRAGGVWVTLGDDVWRYADGVWEPMGLGVRYPYRVSASPDGTEVWAATQDAVSTASGLRHRAADGSWTAYTSRDVPMPHNRISDVEAVGPGEAWYSGVGRLVHLRDGVATDHSDALGLLRGVAGPKLALGPGGTLYAARRTPEIYAADVLFWYDGQDWHSARGFGFEVTGNHAVRINDVSVDPRGRPWVLTNWGLSVLADGVWRPYLMRGLSLDDTVGLSAEGDGAVWIGDYSGVHRFEPEALPTARGDGPGPGGPWVSAPYPNPTAGPVRLDVRGTSGSAVEVADLLGRVVRSGGVGAEGAVELDLSGLPAGLYLVRVRGENGTATRRVVKR